MCKSSVIGELRIERTQGPGTAHERIRRIRKTVQQIINVYAYGWSGAALPAATKSLVMVAMMPASGHPNESCKGL
jgi:hypothetical protein